MTVTSLDRGRQLLARAREAHRESQVEEVRARERRLARRHTELRDLALGLLAEVTADASTAVLTVHGSDDDLLAERTPATVWVSIQLGSLSLALRWLPSHWTLRVVQSCQFCEVRHESPELTPRTLDAVGGWLEELERRCPNQDLRDEGLL